MGQEQTKKEGQNLNRSDSRVLIFPAMTPRTSSGKQINFLFSVKQIGDVVPYLQGAAAVRPVPFSPPYVDGIADWRDNVVPVISLEKCLGLKTTNSGVQRLLLVRSVRKGAKSGARELGMVKSVSAIRMFMLPIPATPAANVDWIPNMELVRAVYQSGEAYLVVVRMESILNGEIR